MSSMDIESRVSGDELSSSPPEMSLPPFHRLLEMEFILPCAFFFAFFRFAALFVQTFCWHDYQGFKQYRLRNLSICLLHSFLSGSWAFIFFIFNPTPMFEDTLHWYEPWATNLPIMSIAYFMNDSIDMAQHEISKWTVELFLHHAASIIAFLFAVLPRKFLLYSYWALLMEVNSVFLHIRSIMQISATSETRPRLYLVVKTLNIITFIIFRFFVQAWQLTWGFRTYNQYHFCYSVIAIGCGFMFITINSILFYRIISSDGLLGESMRPKSGGGRDAQTFVKAIGVEKQKKRSE